MLNIINESRRQNHEMPLWVWCLVIGIMIAAAGIVLKWLR